MYRNLHRMVIFSRVVDAGSFTAAAEALGLSKSVVSHHVSELESHFDVKLLNRTTRKVTPTEFGVHFYKRCKEIDDVSRIAGEEALSFARQPLGTLTIQAPHAVMGRSFARLLSVFRDEFPGIEVRLIADDGANGPCGTAADVCISIGTNGACGDALVPLWEHRAVLVASHEYIDNCGLEICADNSDQLAFVGFDHDGTEITRRFHNKKTGKMSELGFRPTVRASTVPAVCALVRAGLGVAVLPRWLAERDNFTIDLEPIMPELTPVTGLVCVGHRFAENPPRNVTLFMDHVAAARRDAPEDWIET